MVYRGKFEINVATRAFLAREPGIVVGGKRIAGRSKGRIPVFDPASGLPIAEVVDAVTEDVNDAVERAHAAFRDGRWRNKTPAERERILFRFAELIEKNGEALAQLETLEQGKSIHLSRLFASAGSAEWLRYAAGLTTKVEGRTMDLSMPPGPDRWTAYTRRAPVGVVAGIVPWNFPMAIATWKFAPALAAGCSVVLKPSEFTPLSALWLAELALEAGLPDDVLNVVTGTGQGAGSALVSHRLIRKITFTGSTATGKAIARAALENMVPIGLELGGKNPAVVLADADLEVTVPGLMGGGFFNQGQVCAAASRIYVEEAIHDQLVEALADAIKSLPVGAGMDPAAQVTPLVSREHKTKVTRYLDDAKAKAKVIAGAQVPEGDGYFVSPHIVIAPADNVALKREEVFGPVIAIQKVGSRDEAIALANDTDMGLAASVWTQNLKAAMTLTRQLDAGTVWVNTHSFIDPALPFGGIKQSGLGREFGTDWVNAYTELKSICISH
ncbi:MAG: aldehyde dehydrogenase family protein [Acetobacter aceti]|uniref:NAD-dependent phenylacetaldehyde dehydrogenase n=1 Tax=Acetobacter aceti TaxID=435 RepID=A0A1U9KDQ0_ACEAC|nr:aldehyde dehydrogenase family protein [Acetobacter aceti]AQS83859.1 NAD-dependent phenylacetaldehyde dehydrogenase [Acetobacter aceti]